jgi:hypothetical protein
MAQQITITLTDALERVLADAAHRRGLSLEDAALMLLSNHLRMLPILPDDPDELERMLIQGIQSPARSLTREEWDRKTRELIERHRRTKAG